MKDFLSAALPWILLGLAVAVFAARPFSRKAKDGAGDCCAEGMSVGMCLGCAVGAAGVVNIGTGVAMGMLIGMCVGMQIKKTGRTENENDHP